ncbi:unnamed protein product, partial [Rotaria sp. Silwood2]
IERILPIAGESQKQEFSYVLSKQIYHSVSEGHLWFSIFSRPPSNRFTRVQRCTCCFVLLFTAMFLNILYYDQANEAKTTKTTESLSFGPLYITPQQIGIGVIVELLSLVPTLLLIQLFRRTLSRRSSQQTSPLREALYKLKQESMPIESNRKKQSKCIFPWWFLFIIYGLSFLLAIISTFFIIVRGIEFGDLKTQKWLTSLISGFFSSILLIQPLKKQSPFTHRTQIHVNRLDENELVGARDRRVKELHMWSIIRELLTYLCFLMIIYLTTYSNINPNAFLQVKQLRNFFLNTKQIDRDYTKILTIDQYWNWLENSFVSNIRAQQWYNDEAPRNLSGFINDKSNRLIGWAIMRQLRIKIDSCETKISSVCKRDYSFFNEEKQSFEPGWINQTSKISNSSIRRAFMYRTGDELDTYIYVGDHETYNSGGYVYEYRGRLADLRSNLSELHRLNWIDSQTRAVIIQLSLYNPNVALFTCVTFLVEFLSTGGLFPQSRFEPLSFQAITSVFQLVCTIIYIFFIIYYMIIEIQNIFQMKWSYFLQSIRIGDRFKETNGYTYINLQLSVYVNDVLTFLLGFCCFFGSLKILRLCRFHQRLSLFIETLQYAMKDLILFTFMFFIVFMAFLTLFYLLFVGKISSCSTLLNTAQVLFEMMLMQFDAHELEYADAFLGPFCFSLFIFLAVFLCMSMFITIISDSFRIVRDNAKNNLNENYQILLYMFRKFQQWLELIEERDEQMRSKYRDPIEIFPNKIGQLLNAFNRVRLILKNYTEIYLFIYL